MTFCRAVSARTGMVTMAVRQAAAKAKPIEVLRIMTITCDGGPEQTPEKAFPFPQSLLYEVHSNHNNYDVVRILRLGWPHSPLRRHPNGYGRSLIASVVSMIFGQ